MEDKNNHKKNYKECGHREACKRIYMNLSPIYGEISFSMRCGIYPHFVKKVS